MDRKQDQSSPFLARAWARFEAAEIRLMEAKAAACFFGLAFLNGRLLDTAHLGALSRRIQQAEEAHEAARQALARIRPGAPRYALNETEAVERFIRELERLAADHGLPDGLWPRADLYAMATELIRSTP